jgi:integrase
VLTKDPHLPQQTDREAFVVQNFEQNSTWLLKPRHMPTRITTDAIRRFIRKRQEDGVEPSTINRNLALLRRMLSLARQESKIQTVPYCPMLKENKPRQGFLTHEQFETLRAALPQRLAALITFLYFTGCRIGAARKIRWQQLDLDRHEIRLEADQTKNDEPITLPLPQDVVTMLRQAEHGPERQSDLVFDLGSFRTAWENTCAKLGFGTLTENGAGRHYEGLLVHDLRRSAVRNLRLAGVPESIAMKISGHKTRAIFDRYNIVSTEDLHQAMSKVEARSKVLDVPVTNENNARTMKVAPQLTEKTA